MIANKMLVTSQFKDLNQSIQRHCSKMTLSTIKTFKDVKHTIVSRGRLAIGRNKHVFLTLP